MTTFFEGEKLPDGWTPPDDWKPIMIDDWKLDKKPKFCKRLRKKTSYPTLRNLISRFYSLMYYVLALSLLGVIYVALFENLNIIDNFKLFIFPFVGLVILKAWYESTMLLIDIADSVLYSAQLNEAIYVLTSKQTKGA